MSNVNRNRLSIESEDEDVVYRDSTIPERKPLRFAAFLWGGVMLLFLILAGFAIYYFQTAREQPDLADEDVLEEGPEYRYYFPAGEFSAPLQSAIAAYRAHERSEARRRFQNFIESDAANKEKATALVYLGVMSLETERYADAKHQLFRALRYDPDSVAALVNLAITEQRLGNPAEARQYAMQARELAPDNSRVAMVLGNILAEGRQPEEAIEFYREGLSERPGDPELHYNLALSLLRQENYNEAISEFRNAIDAAEVGRIAARSHAYLGQIYFGRENFEMAADELEKAVTLAPDNATFLYNLGMAYLRLNRSQDALRNFERSLETGSSENRVYRRLAEAFLQMDQPSLAIQALRRAIDNNSEDVSALFKLADIYKNQKDLLNASEIYKRIVNITTGDSYTVDALIELGEIHIDLERYRDAVDFLERAERLNPENPRIKLVLGRSYLRAGNRMQALEVWREALRGDLERADEREIRLALGDYYRSEGAYESAIDQYNFIVARNQEPPVREEDPELDLRIGSSNESLKRWNNARIAYERAASAVNANVEIRKTAYQRLAVILLEEGNSDQARSYAMRAQRLDPNDLEIQVLRAEILLSTQSAVDRERAIEILMAVTTSQVDAKIASYAYNQLGLAFQLNGEYSRAIRSFDNALQLDPSNRDAYRNQRSAVNAREQNIR